MSSDLLGVIDIGKTHTRFFVADADSGKILSDAYRPSQGCDSTVVRELDVFGIESWLIEVIGSHPQRRHIHTLVPIAHGAAAVLIDSERKILIAPDYEDGRFEAVGDSYRERRDPFEFSYSPFLPLGLNLGRQLYYLQTRHQQLFERAHTLLLFPQYWAWRFSGVAASELTSLGCHSDLWRPLQSRPTHLVERQGWTSLLPTLHAAGGVVGTVSQEMASLAGLNPDCRVLCGLHDSNASFLSHLATRSTQPFAVVSSGTWTVIMARGADLRRIREPLDMLVNVDAFGGPVATARFMGGREYEIVAGDSGREVVASEKDVAAVISSRAFALPAFFNAGGPFARVRGRLISAELINAAQRAALATVYIALMTDYLLGLLDAHGDVIIDGPLARNPIYASVLAALRPQNPVFLTYASVPAVTASCYLNKSVPMAQNCSLVPPSNSTEALLEYRAAWLTLLEKHCQSDTTRIQCNLI